MFAKSTLLCLFPVLFCCREAEAQNYLNNALSKFSSQPVASYINVRHGNLLLYNGIEYARSYPNTTGYPFFLTDTFQRSALLYDDVWYENIPLAYDAVSNRVIIKNKDSFLIELVPEKVGSFVFRNHVFVSLTPAFAKPDVILPGLYEMYDFNTVAVFIRHQKAVQRAGNPADLDRFANFDAYFIRKENGYFPIKNSNALSEVFADRSNEIKSFLHQSKLSFKKNPEETIVKAAAYYARLKK